MAVEVALRIDPRQRYPTAVEMGHALEEGARGILPGAGTAIVPPSRAGERASTSASTVVADTQTRVSAGVTPRQPRAGEPRRQPVAEQPAQRASRGGRIAAILVGIAVLAAAIIVIVISLQPSGRVTLQNGRWSHDAGTLIGQLTQLIDTNTG